ncbi:helix-turn-helix domain-containing protein [Rhizobium sp. RAF56]|uniref:helix-turn-helix domain-containing protein n=1 Tax=Rhizobium sp. RAF56 TaxID=3233062 RepID=UPI003F9913CB
MTSKEAAEYLRRSIVTLERWRHEKKGPPYVRQYGRVYYLRADLDAYIEARRVRGAQ